MTSCKIYCNKCCNCLEKVQTYHCAYKHNWPAECSRLQFALLIATLVGAASSNITLFILFHQRIATETARRHCTCQASTFTKPQRLLIQQQYKNYFTKKGSKITYTQHMKTKNILSKAASNRCAIKWCLNAMKLKLHGPTGSSMPNNLPPSWVLVPGMIQIIKMAVESEWLKSLSAPASSALAYVVLKLMK